MFQILDKENPDFFVCKGIYLFHVLTFMSYLLTYSYAQSIEVIAKISEVKVGGQEKKSSTLNL